VYWLEDNRSGWHVTVPKAANVSRAVLPTAQILTARRRCPKQLVSYKQISAHISATASPKWSAWTRHARGGCLLGIFTRWERGIFFNRKKMLGGDPVFSWLSSVSSVSVRLGFWHLQPCIDIRGDWICSDRFPRLKNSSALLEAVTSETQFSLRFDMFITP
jgi:hypothetical protein